LDTTQSADAAKTDTGASPKRGRGCGCWIAVLAVLLLGGGATATLGAMFALRQEVPLEPEAALADVAKRTLMIEWEYKDRRIPPDLNTAESITQGKQLYDVQCSLCHGQPGGDVSTLGLTMFPPAIDLSRDRTQTKTAGEIFWLIAHGLNYTGMPAWGEKYGGSMRDEDIWKLVAYLQSVRAED
jgi:mono/diheme cytochrome c family protein